MLPRQAGKVRDLGKPQRAVIDAEKHLTNQRICNLNAQR
jgi:hypothetical protein